MDELNQRSSKLHQDMGNMRASISTSLFESAAGVRLGSASLQLGSSWEQLTPCSRSRASKVRFQVATSSKVEAKQLAEKVATRSFDFNSENQPFIDIARHLHELSKQDGDHTAAVDAWKLVSGTCRDDTLRRWVESHASVALAVTRRYHGEFNPELAMLLVGSEGFDSLVFSDKLSSASEVRHLLKESADPNARDAPFGFTASHIMAYSATLASLFPEPWHLDRIRILGKAGADHRSAVDLYGRTPMLIALENSNVTYVKSLLRVELGENWGLQQMRNVALFAMDGELVKSMLHTEKMLNLNRKSSMSPQSPGKSRHRMRQNEKAKGKSDVRSLLMQGGVRPVFRRLPNMPCGVYWAAYYGNAATIELLAHLGLPMDPVIKNVNDPMMETPLIIAAARGNLSTVEMLLRCNANPHKLNSHLRTPLEVALEASLDPSTQKTLQDLFRWTYPPFQQTMWGKELCWDSVVALAKMIDHEVLEVDSVEELCSWYRNLHADPQDRVLEFWRLMCEFGEAGVFA